MNQVATVKSDGLNLRVAPASSSLSIDELNHGDVLDIERSNGTWLYVKARRTGKSGWVHSAYVTFELPKIVPPLPPRVPDPIPPPNNITPIEIWIFVIALAFILGGIALWGWMGQP